ncbi:MAG: helix-turn-helix domain-containing protein [Mangrovibacterium sp.]
MESRIQHILDLKQITAKEFADTIDVLPSNVSHVLNKRNNPSYPFIEKILSAYPDLNARWLILGEGNAFDYVSNEIQEKVIDQDLFSQLEVEKIPEVQPSIKSETMKLVDTEVLQESISIDIPKMAKEVEEKKPIRQIDRIITFYSDQTFEEFFPKN